ncbi:MAG: hypothetical protein ABIJ21_00690 [Nanoarchaeota archaeon]
MAEHIAETFVVSIDFDGVLALGWPVKMKYAKEWFGVDLTLEQTKKEAFEALMLSKGRSGINYRSLMDPLNEGHIMEYAVPDGCIDALRDLYGKGFRFVVITSRNDHDYPYAKAFLKQKFGDLIRYVHNTRDEPKGKFVSKLKPRIHIDDDLEKLAEIANLPVELIYFRQPENAHESAQGSRILDTPNWYDIKRYCETMRNIHEAICWKYKIENVYRNISRIFALRQAFSPNEIDILLKEYFAT